jgi:hypothetical protein
MVSESSSMSVSESASASSKFLYIYIYNMHLSALAMRVRYSESPRTHVESGPILIKVRCNLACFRSIQSFDLLGWGSSPHIAFRNYTLVETPRGFRQNHSEQKMQTNCHDNSKNLKRNFVWGKMRMVMQQSYGIIVNAGSACLCKYHVVHLLHRLRIPCSRRRRRRNEISSVASADDSICADYFVQEWWCCKGLCF